MSERKQGYLHSVGVRDVTNRLPPEELLDPSSQEVPDIYICALGFEARAIALSAVFSQNFDSSSAKATSLIGEYRTNRQDNEINKPALLEQLRHFSDRVLTADADSPHNVHKVISELIQQRLSDGVKQVKTFFDVSGASANFILSVMYSLMQHSELINLTVFYAEAGEYHPRKDLWDNDPSSCISQACDFGDNSTFLDFGVETPEKNELYPGFYHDARPDFVIAIPGYRTQRLVRCISSLGEQILANPRQNMYWIFGSPPRPERSWRLDFQREMLIRMFNQFSGSLITNSSELFDSCNSKNCSTMDYRETLACILDVADKHLGYRVSVVPMGSKLQTIGLALALAVREEVGVTVARPSKFNSNLYSEAVSSLYKINFGVLSVIRGQLIRVGQLKYQPIGGEVGMEQPSI